MQCSIIYISIEFFGFGAEEEEKRRPEFRPTDQRTAA